MAIKTILNPDKSIVDSIRCRLEITQGQCPCVPSTEWNEDTICPCKIFRATRECHCELYVNIEQ